MNTTPAQSLLEVAGQKFGELNSAEKRLFTLAQEKFQELRDSEYKLFRAIANGKPIDYRTGSETDDKPDLALHWGDERTLRSGHIRWLCTEPEVWKLCLPQGIDVLGAKIEGALNLSFSDVEIPLRFSLCCFAEALRLQQARLRRLDLSGTHIVASQLTYLYGAPPTLTAIDAREISVTGSVRLCQGFLVQGVVIFIGATIGGNFDCHGGIFTHENELALFAPSINVAGSVALCDGFQARGIVNLAGATIGRDFNCQAGTFTHEDGDALVAHSVNVAGFVLLRNGFQARGTVSLANATIGGAFDCQAGTFTHEDGDALLLESINVTGSVLLRNGFQARGTVSLANATIGGAFDCQAGTFTHEDGDALVAHSVNVASFVALRNGFQARGTVNLAGATIGGAFDCQGGTFTHEDGDALFLESIKVTGSVALCNGFQSRGTVSLANATIGGAFDCQVGTFTHEDGYALLAQSVNVAGSVALCNGFQARGVVNLAGATIGGDFNCQAGTFTCEDGDALLVQSINVAGSVWLCNGFQARGMVSLAGATIRRGLDCQAGTFTHEDGYALLAQSVNVAGSVWLCNGFQARGIVSLAGATIGGDFNCQAGTFTCEDGAALLAQNINVTGSAWLCNGFQARGTVRLHSATIRGDFDCQGGTFTCEDGAALLAQSINVTGSVALCNGFQAQGNVTLTNATIGGHLQCNGGTFNESDFAFIADGIKVTGNISLNDGFQAQGSVVLLGATIGGDLDCSTGIVKKGWTNDKNREKKRNNILVLWSKKICREALSKPSQDAKNSLLWFLIDCLVIDTLIVDRAKEIYALVADDLDVKGNILLRGLEAEGRVTLNRSRVGKTLKITEIEAPLQMLLDVQFAKIQTLEYAEDSFPASGNLLLNGLVYESLGKRASQKYNNHLKWLRLQPEDSFSSQPYEQLAKILQSTGYREEAVQVLIGKEDDQLRYGELNWLSKFWKRVLSITIAYGYRPQRAIFIAIGIAVFGSVLFGRGYQHNLITPTEKDCKPTSSQAINDCSNYTNYSKFDPIIYSLDVFLPIIDLRLKNSWQPNANNGKLVDNLFHFKTGRWLRYYFWLHIFLGWVLTTLWVAGFSGLVRNTNK